MDAISSLVGGLNQAQATVNGAAQQIAADGLPTTASPDPTNPVNPDPAAATGVDVAQQLTTMMVAADTHHLTTVALRAALSMYQDTLDILPAARD
jgi:hypothetical protein